MPTRAKGEVIKIRRGGVIVSIYPYDKKGETYYHVVDYSSGKRKFRGFSNLVEAKREAELIAAKLATGQADVLQLSSSDRVVYLRALKLLAPINVSLDSAIGQFVEASTLLGSASITEAARFYLERNPSRFPTKTVNEVAQELLADKRSKGSGVRYLQDLKYRCGRFAESFTGPIGAITTTQVEQFLLGLQLSPQSYTNFRRVIITLFEFAKKRGYVSSDHSVALKVDRVRVLRGDIEIFRHAELRELLAKADSDFLPSLAIGAFAGLRSAEIEKLDWKDVQLERGWIQVRAQKAKTASRRLVPVASNLVLWLAPHAKAQGPVWPFGHEAFYDAQQDTASNTATKTSPAMKWKKNALRHSYISYRLALVQNENQVAMESGNSPDMIHHHYKQLVTQEEGREWFEIKPA